MTYLWYYFLVKVNIELVSGSLSSSERDEMRR
jgi:hypothetical protein